MSGQYARFQQGSEYSLEVTWKRQLTESISLQPSFQYIKNDNGDFTALSARLYVNF
ncbi:carbohydrate porin [Segatella hominis]|uniref:carbohydrate porin n=1 Tax=Segatella hominis TaxID=2518605 RepID=UPI003AB9A0B4